MCLVSKVTGRFGIVLQMGFSILSRKRPRYRRRKSMSMMGRLVRGVLLLVLGLHLLLHTSLFVVGTVLVAVALPILVVAVTTKPVCLPPGPKGVPFLGYLPFLTTELPHQHLAELSQKFGQLVHFQLGSTPAVLVASPAMMEVLMPQVWTVRFSVQIPNWLFRVIKS